MKKILLYLFFALTLTVNAQNSIKKILVVKNNTTDFQTKLYNNSVVLDSNQAKFYLLPTGAERTDKLDSVSDLIILGDIFVKKVVLDSSDIKHLNSLPETLVAAPGTGYYLDVISVFTDYDYATAQYTGDSSVTVYYGGLSAYGALGNAIDGGSDKMNKITLTANGAIGKNLPLLIKSTTSNPVGATALGTLTVYVAYRKVKL